MLTDDKMLAYLLDTMEEGTNWEINFLESIEKRLRHGDELSPKQGALLDRLFNKHYRGQGL